MNKMEQIKQPKAKPDLLEDLPPPKADMDTQNMEANSSSQSEKKDLVDMQPEMVAKETEETMEEENNESKDKVRNEELEEGELEEGEISD